VLPATATDAAAHGYREIRASAPLIATSGRTGEGQRCPCAQCVVNCVPPVSFTAPKR